MAKARSDSPLAEVYAKVWKACLELWPLFIIQLLVVVLAYLFLFFSCLLLFGPFAAKYGREILEGINHLPDFSWDALGAQAVDYFSNPSWWILFGALFSAGLTFLSLLAAFVDGGVYRTLWAGLRSGKRFNSDVFLKEGVFYLLPMLCFQAVMLIYTALLGLVTLLGVGLLGGMFWLAKGSAGSILIALFLMIPLGLVWVGLFFWFMGYPFAFKAKLTAGDRTAKELQGTLKDFTGALQGGAGRWIPAFFILVWDQLRITFRASAEAFQSYRARRWRIALGMLVAFLVYLTLVVAKGILFKVLGLIPLLGVGFKFLDFLLDVGLGVAVSLYFPALAVGFFAEDE